MLIFSQKSWSSKEDILAHLKHMYWEHIRRRVVKSLHPGGVLLQHWVGSVQDRGAAAFQSHIKVPVLCITRNAAFPPWEQHCQHGADPSQSASLTSWALIEAAHWKHILPLPLQHCRAAGGGERSAVGPHHLSQAAQGGVSRTQSAPKQGGREQKHHVAGSCQPAGPKIDVLPEVLIQASLVRYLSISPRCQEAAPLWHPSGWGGGRVKPHPTEEGRSRALPKVGVPAH